MFKEWVGVERVNRIMGCLKFGMRMYWARDGMPECPNKYWTFADSLFRT
jgi:hypothetical protein